MPNWSSDPALNWTIQKVRVRHLIEYARYREKLGDAQAALTLLLRLRGVPKDELVTYSDLAAWESVEVQYALKDAGAFVLDLYRDLGLMP